MYQRIYLGSSVDGIGLRAWLVGVGDMCRCARMTPVLNVETPNNQHENVLRVRDPPPKSSISTAYQQTTMHITQKTKERTNESRIITHQLPKIPIIANTNRHAFPGLSRILPMKV